MPRGVGQSDLPSIPVFDLGDQGPVALFHAHPAGAAALLRQGRRTYTGLGLAIGDRVSARFARRAELPYGAEVAAVAAAAQALGHRGGWLLNLSYEWGCTTGVADDPDGTGMVMRRTLDWPVHGLGRHVAVARHRAPAGPWINVTWPGFVGVLTAIAPGRFAAAINQAPMTRHGLTIVGDWLVNRRQVFRSRAIPPAFLLRQVFEECRGYDEARRVLAETPLCLPALFTLAGARAGEDCVIERLETAAFIHAAPAAVANSWLTSGLKGRPRGHLSAERHAHLCHAQLPHATAAHDGDVFSWLAPPVLNRDTRLAVVANAGTGRLVVQGWEPDGPATRVLELAA
jgi:hypothetical protein